MKLLRGGLPACGGAARREYEREASALSRKTTRAAAARRRENIGVILRLIFCFPLGLYMMWTRTRWPRTVKIGVSALIAFAIVAILVPLTDPPARQIGGVRVVGSAQEVDVLGPEAPSDREIIDVYTPQRAAIIVEPTATPQPVIVYCNQGGKYYHNKDCKWVRATTPAVTLEQAIRAGLKPCEECGAPEPVS